MDNQGWIKDHRKEMDSDIWVMPPLYIKVWQYLKYMANHKRNDIPMADGSKEIIERGQHLTSYRGIARGVAYYENGKYKEPNPKTIKKIIDWLEKNKMVTRNAGKGNRQYTKITIVNYSVYQSDNSEEVTEKAQQSNSEVTPSTHESNSKVTVKKQSVDINKNDKNDNNDIRMKKNEKEGEEEKPPSQPPLSLLNDLQMKILNIVSENTFRTFLWDAEIREDDKSITLVIKDNFTRQYAGKSLKDKISQHIMKDIQIIGE